MADIFVGGKYVEAIKMPTFAKKIGMVIPQPVELCDEGTAGAQWHVFDGGREVGGGGGRHFFGVVYGRADEELSDQYEVFDASADGKWVRCRTKDEALQVAAGRLSDNDMRAIQDADATSPFAASPQRM